MAKKFSSIKERLGLVGTPTHDPTSEEWRPADTYREFRLRILRRNLKRGKHQLILEPLRALRFLRQYADRGSSAAELSDKLCLGVLGVIEMRHGQVVITNAGRRLLEETKSWPHMLLIHGSSSPLRPLY